VGRAKAPHPMSRLQALHKNAEVLGRPDQDPVHKGSIPP
jgi:hypothetical protein